MIQFWLKKLQGAKEFSNHTFFTVTNFQYEALTKADEKVCQKSSDILKSPKIEQYFIEKQILFDIKYLQKWDSK